MVIDGPADDEIVPPRPPVKIKNDVVFGERDRVSVDVPRTMRAPMPPVPPTDDGTAAYKTAATDFDELD